MGVLGNDRNFFLFKLLMPSGGIHSALFKGIVKILLSNYGPGLAERVTTA